ncbi:MAG: hypothetical protein ACE5GK_07390 [Nitrospiria bacterium]
MKSTYKAGIVGVVVGTLFFVGTLASQAQETFFIEGARNSQIQREAELTVAGGMMTRALNAALQGKTVEPIPQDIVNIFKKHGAYNQLSNFMIAVNLLEKESGKSLGHLLPNTPSTIAKGGHFRGHEEGWGGWGEFGYFAVVGFIFSLWAHTWVARSSRPPMEEEEEEEEYMEYKKAA